MLRETAMYHWGVLDEGGRGTVGSATGGFNGSMYLLKIVNMLWPRASSFAISSSPGHTHWLNMTSSVRMGTQRNAAGRRWVVGEALSSAYNGMEIVLQWNGM